MVVDLRKENATYGGHIKIELDSLSGKSLFIPKGIACGFLSLSAEIFAYKCDAYYNSSSEGGIIYNDSHLAIDWEYPEHNLYYRTKTYNYPLLKVYEEKVNTCNRRIRSIGKLSTKN